ncbi:glycosyltransferase family 15 protein [Mycena amicta]|nr:glycosyltransferase family 15 protein [Mycena amicta]
MRPRPDNAIPDEYYTHQRINSELDIAARPRANATFVILARNSDMDNTVQTASSGPVMYGQVPKEHWVQPDWIDEDRATKGRDALVAENVIYGGSPDVHFHCNINFDPFLYMQDRNKVYGWTMYEFDKTIPTLWGHVKDFVRLHPEHIAKDNALGFMSHDNGETYNRCHFWSNFEIADMHFWRGKAYQDFFAYLDSKGGFYYERWGDAPVHSIAAGLFASKDQLQFFEEIGYEHNPYTHCPKDPQMWEKGKCGCAPERSFDYDGYSCMRQWDDFIRG